VVEYSRALREGGHNDLNRVCVNTSDCAGDAKEGMNSNIVLKLQVRNGVLLSESSVPPLSADTKIPGGLSLIILPALRCNGGYTVYSGKQAIALRGL
jgi:hypothetical protein